MWEKVGVVRSEESLREALTVLMSHYRLLEGCHLSRRMMETYNLSTVAMLIATSALMRRGSIGVHFRSDYPKSRGRDWRGHQTLSQRIMTSFEFERPLAKYRSGLSV